MEHRYLGDQHCQFQIIGPEASLVINFVLVTMVRIAHRVYIAVCQPIYDSGRKGEKNDPLAKVYCHICKKFCISTMPTPCFYLFA